MGWRTHYFGTENPTRGHRIAIHSIIAVLTLVAYGYWNDFIPEERWSWWGLYASAVAAAMLTGWLMWLGISRRNPGFTGNVVALAALSPLMFVALGGFLWMALVHGVAGAYTRLLGTREVEVATVRLEYRYGRECHYQARGRRLDYALPGHLCVRSLYYDSLPGHLVDVELHGQRSVFGFNVSGVRHRADLGAGSR